MEENEIPRRENEFDEIQYNASEINIALKKYRPKDCFCLVALLNTDIYPTEENEKGLKFVKGLAFPAFNTAVFSFARYAREAAEWDEKEEQTLSRQTNVMTHEISHLFGLMHCPYYECLMNGGKSPEEGRRKPKPIVVCPVCLKKLHCNLKFQTADRFIKLMEICKELNFMEEAQAYQTYLSLHP